MSNSQGMKIVGFGWPTVVGPPSPVHKWEEILEKKKDKSVYEDKIIQLNTILDKEAMKKLMRLKSTCIEMRHMIDTPPSTLGYKKDECLIHWDTLPMKEDDLKAIASADLFGDTEENMKTPSQVNIAAQGE